MVQESRILHHWHPGAPSFTLEAVIAKARGTPMSDAGHIFISYVREDTEMVDALAAALRSEGALLWLDRESIEPGQRWQDAMRRAIEGGNFFLACFSENWMLKRKSVMNEELVL